MSAEDYKSTVRRGRRFSGASALLYVLGKPDASPTRFGFIVSKGIGNSVVRNRVTRRLRAIGSEYVRSQPTGKDVVIRALPACAGVSWSTLQSEILAGLERSAAQ